MKNIDNISFEDAMAILEESVNKLEQGELTLDESLKIYEEAIKLVSVCNQRLDSAKQRVQLLTETTEGIFTQTYYSGSNDEA